MKRAKGSSVYEGNQLARQIYGEEDQGSSPGKRRMNDNDGLRYGHGALTRRMAREMLMVKKKVVIEEKDGQQGEVVVMNSMDEAEKEKKNKGVVVDLTSQEMDVEESCSELTENVGWDGGEGEGAGNMPMLPAERSTEENESELPLRHWGWIPWKSMEEQALWFGSSDILYQ